MLAPRRQKYRKQFKPKSKIDIAVGGTEVSFGQFGLRVEEKGNISSRQIEAARKAITHFTKRGGRVWIRIFPDFPITRKAAEVPMGNGKGDLQGYQVQVLPGRVVFELDGIEEKEAKEALRKAGTKLPVKTVFVTR